MDVVLALIEAVDWQPLSAIAGDAVDVPRRLKNLIRATEAPEADAAYWQLDNHVIVQGRMFGAAPFVVAPLSVVLFSGALSAPSRLAVLNLSDGDCTRPRTRGRIRPGRDCARGAC